MERTHRDGRRTRQRGREWDLEAEAKRKVECVDRSGAGGGGRKPLGTPYAEITGARAGTRLVAMGFLYDMQGACDAVTVQPVEVRAMWRGVRAR